MSKRIFVGAAAVLAASLVVAPAAGADYTFSNSAPITINDAVTPDVPTPATPYPSTVSVPSLELSTTRRIATVFLHGVSHTSPADIKVQLVTPNGTAILLENAGGVTTPVTDATIAFSNDVQVGALVPFDGPLVTGTYGLSAYTNTSTVVNQSYNIFRYAPGDWAIYVSDQDPGDTGVVAGGVSVFLRGSVTTPRPPRPPSNLFTFGAQKLDQRRGTASLPVNVPGPGLLSLKGTKTVRTMTLNVPKAGVYPLAIKTRGKALKRLRSKRKIEVDAEVHFTPTGGTGGYASKRVTLKLKKVKKKRK